MCFPRDGADTLYKTHFLLQGRAVAAQGKGEHDTSNYFQGRFMKPHLWQPPRTEVGSVFGSAFGSGFGGFGQFGFGQSWGAAPKEEIPWQVAQRRRRRHAKPAPASPQDTTADTTAPVPGAQAGSEGEAGEDGAARAACDKRPMLWHVRRRIFERLAGRLGLPAAHWQSLLWVASERGDACGYLYALAQADPAGLSLPPELRRPFGIWAVLSDLTSRYVFYTLSEAAVFMILSVCKG